MSEEPLISIILPVHNGRRYLKQAIESCLNQTYRNLELIIVDDGSTDDSLLIAAKYQVSDNRVKIISNGENLTLPVSLNIGHKLAKGDLITWTSDDNFYQKDAVATLYKAIIQHKADIVYCDYLLIDEHGTLIGKTILKPIEFLLFYGVIGACFLYRKEVFHRNVGYNDKLFLVEDYDFWLRALKHSHFYKIENPGYYYYRYHANSLTERMKTEPDLKNQFLRNLQELYEELFDELPLKNKQVLVQFLILRFKEGANDNIVPIINKGFFTDIGIISHYLRDFSDKNLKKYILEDVLDTILQKKKFQKPINVYNLHREVKGDLIYLPIDKYLAIIKKCLF
jgi:glycosyltransferase involved in cell wall biosynthesis